MTDRPDSSSSWSRRLSRATETRRLRRAAGSLGSSATLSSLSWTEDAEPPEDMGWGCMLDGSVTYVEYMEGATEADDDCC
jgi:hypothetical protein